MPAVLRCVRELCGGAADDGLETADLEAWARACCAAAEAFVEFGEGRVGGYAIGDFRVTNYMEKGATGLEVARALAAGDLVRIDCGTQTTAVNGADATADVTLGSDFFGLAPGRAALAFEGCSSHLASWRERWA